MTVYTSLTNSRLVPALLRPVYGETTTYASLLLIHGGTLLITGLLWWVFRRDPLLQNPELAQIAMWLLWDLAGGSLAHLTKTNHQYWARLPVEMRLLALASMAWQPIVLVVAFDQSMLLLVELHLFAGVAYWLLTRTPVYIVLAVGMATWAWFMHQLDLPAPIAILSLLYCLKAILAYRPEQMVPNEAEMTSPSF